jgi:16S rRNA (uracil1498-N3)-methyltransferase
MSSPERDVYRTCAAAQTGGCIQRPEQDCLRLIAWEEEQSQTLTAFLHTLKAMPRAAAILIGPEGGFTPGEAQTAVQSGWHSVSLGRRILRMETAAVVAAALTIDYFENQPD